MSMVFHGLVLDTSMDFDGRSWISMVDHQIPCSPWSFMVTISQGLKAFDFDECVSRLLFICKRTQSIVIQMQPYKVLECFLEVS